MGNLWSSSAAPEKPRRHPTPSWGFLTATWNVAAINNNPFEYWLTLNSQPAYEQLMKDVQAFVDQPGDGEATVADVFSKDMAKQLADAIKQAKLVDDESLVDGALNAYTSDFAKRRVVSDFLKDKTIGDKRLASMPDRITNTVNTTNGPVYRPTVINMYTGDMSSVEAWWPQWLAFMFETPITIEDAKSKSSKTSKGAAHLLDPILRTKYPAITEQEEAMSVPLQCFAQAIFDATLVYMLNKLLPEKWIEIKKDVCEALCERKEALTLDIVLKRLASEDRTSTIIFLQECSAKFVSLLRDNEEIADLYEVVAPAKLDAKRDQNSVILIDNDKFDISSMREVTDEIISLLPEGAPLKPATGDLVAVQLKLKPLDILDSPKRGIFDRVNYAGTETGYTDRETFLFASFHGDTNGLLTPYILKALNARRREFGQFGRLMVGIDANAHCKGEPGKKLGINTLLAFMRTKRTCSPLLTSCWKLQTWELVKHNFDLSKLEMDDMVTTYNARTFLQTQLNKAVRVSELQTSKLTDRNPKDLIIYPESDFVFMDHSLQRDNNGRGFFDDAPFPTLEFPSDHAFLTCELNLRRRNFSDPEHMPWDEELPDGMPWNRKGPIEFDPAAVDGNGVEN
ncbi:hypothetical protein PPROV_000365900 [Pycnococcus provasolii]|uniref:Endonuclease/exonuclease/phosphatase domain-containing protein n=1 Tax=Pycnococcus provasolii TaxID=41880 RepID=A0A830HIN4_9CHLO|nr:hypothetical protein PPROV_000365900 [Pycnococcus provasolii]